MEEDKAGDICEEGSGMRLGSVESSRRIVEMPCWGGLGKSEVEGRRSRVFGAVAMERFSMLHPWAPTLALALHASAFSLVEIRAF